MMAFLNVFVWSLRLKFPLWLGSIQEIIQQHLRQKSGCQSCLMGLWLNYLIACKRNHCNSTQSKVNGKHINQQEARPFHITESRLVITTSEKSQGCLNETIQPSRQTPQLGSLLVVAITICNSIACDTHLECIFFSHACVCLYLKAISLLPCRIIRCVRPV